MKLGMLFYLKMKLGTQFLAVDIPGNAGDEDGHTVLAAEEAGHAVLAINEAGYAVLAANEAGHAVLAAEEAGQAVLAVDDARNVQKPISGQPDILTQLSKFNFQHILYIRKNIYIWYLKLSNIIIFFLGNFVTQKKFDNNSFFNVF